MTGGSTISVPGSREPYLTRRQAAEYIREELGVPMAFSTAEKLGALGEFAEPAMWWGRRPLYTRDGLREWVASRARPRLKHVAASAESQIEELDDAALRLRRRFPDAGGER